MQQQLSGVGLIGLLVITLIGCILALAVFYFIGYSKVMKLLLARKDGKLREDRTSGLDNFNDGLVGLFLVVQMIYALGLPYSTINTLIVANNVRKQHHVAMSARYSVIAALISILITNVLSAVGAGMMLNIHFGKKYDEVHSEAYWNTILASLILPLAMLVVYMLVTSFLIRRLYTSVSVPVTP